MKIIRTTGQHSALGEFFRHQQFHWFRLECVREIQNGQLRLAARQFGATDSDSGIQFADPALFFSNPNKINSIASDITLRSFSGTSCSTNPTVSTRTVTSLVGQYFNTGSGQPADDVGDMVALVVDTNNPKTISVSNWMAGNGLGVSTDIEAEGAE